MKIFDPKQHLPVGWDWENTRPALITGHLASGLSMLIFLARYFTAHSALYETQLRPNGTPYQVLIPGITIAPFSELLRGLPWLGFWLFCIAMILQVWRHYRSHTRDSMAIYTMRRLRNPWELHRRCLCQPVLSILAEVLLFAVLTGLGWLLWYFATPVQCRPM